MAIILLLSISFTPPLYIVHVFSYSSFLSLFYYNYQEITTHNSHKITFPILCIVPISPILQIFFFCPNAHRRIHFRPCEEIEEYAAPNLTFTLFNDKISYLNLQGDDPYGSHSAPAGTAAGTQRRDAFDGAKQQTRHLAGDPRPRHGRNP